MMPRVRNAFLVALALGLLVLGVWILDRKPGVTQESATPEAEAVTAKPAALTGDSPSSPAVEIQRETVDPQADFVARWRKYFGDPELRARIHGPRKQILEKMRREQTPMPYEKELKRLADVGVVPVPPKHAFEDLLLEDMDHIRGVLQNQATFFTRLPPSEVKRWREDEANSIQQQTLDYAPEILAAFLMGRDVTSDLSASDSLLAQLADIRTRSLRAWGQAWTEYQFSFHCSAQARGESGYPQAFGGIGEATAELIPEARAVLDRVRASHAEYLRSVHEALRAAFPDETF